VHARVRVCLRVCVHVCICFCVCISLCLSLFERTESMVFAYACMCRLVCVRAENVQVCVCYLMVIPALFHN